MMIETITIILLVLFSFIAGYMARVNIEKMRADVEKIKK